MVKNLDQDFEYCRKLVKEHDYDRYLMSLCAKRDVQKYLWALLAFNHEVSKTREVVTETRLGLIRLQWWREEIDKIYTESDAVKDNQILPVLAEAVREKGLDQERFEMLLYAREFDLEDVAPENMEGLCAYAEYTNAPLLQLIAEICGCDCDPEYLKTLAIAYGLTGLMLAVPYHASQSRRFLPSDMDRGEGGDPDIVRDILCEARRNLDIATQEKIPQPLKSVSRLVRLNMRHIKKCGYNPAHKKYTKLNYFKPLFVSL